MTDAIKEQTNIDFKNVKSLEEAKKIAKEHDITVEKHYRVGHIVEAFLIDSLKNNRSTYICLSSSNRY